MTAMSSLRAIVANPEFVRPDVEPPADRHPTNNLCRDLPARLAQQIEPTPMIGHGPIRSAQGRPCRVLQIDFDVETNAPETIRDVTADCVDLIAAGDA